MGSSEMMEMVAWGGLGGVVGGWHGNVVIDGVTEDNGDGSRMQGQGAAELEAKEGLPYTSRGLES